MKYTTITTLAALLLGIAGAFAQSAYTKPSGFVTHTLKAGQFNLIGLTLHAPVTVSGAFETVDGTTLTDSDVNFGTSLTAGKTYILEITAATDTSLNGTIQEVTVWDGNTITTPQNLVTDGLVVGDQYQLRAAKTLQGIFGANNEAGLKEGASGTADLVWIPDGSGGFDKYYYSPAQSFPVVVAEGWKLLSGADAPEVPIFFADAFFVQRRGATDLDLVITGSIVTTSVSVAVPNNFTFISSLFPVGSTLANSGLGGSLLHGFAGTADLLWLPKDDASGYDIYYYHPGSTFPQVVEAGWKLVGGDVNVDQATTILKSGMIIQRRAATGFNVPVTPPSSYSGL
ncbi:MAG: hypothetical protein KJO21_08220 [Verrucomicrobiae bacterium]|nr:hypothetical protein [Verrucomicrobiae bacterium]NNJ43459.1 hypothetical protein [Akkermansiaceae bacterium]